MPTRKKFPTPLICPFLFRCCPSSPRLPSLPNHDPLTATPSGALADDGVEARLEPLDGVVAVDAVAGTDAALAAATAADALAGAGHAAVEVHAVDTDTGVVLDAEIDVLADAEAEVAGLGEVALAELVLLDLEATLENLLGLGAADGDVDGNLFVTADTEGTDGVAGLACWARALEIPTTGGGESRSGRTVDGGLTGQLLEHLGGTGQSVTRLADRDVKDELLDAKFAHGVLGLLSLFIFALAKGRVRLSRSMASYHFACVVSPGGGEWLRNLRLVVRIWEFPVEVDFCWRILELCAQRCGWGSRAPGRWGTKCGSRRGVAGEAPCCGWLGVELGKLEPFSLASKFRFWLEASPSTPA